MSVKEYCGFLRHGHRIVFGDCISNDKPRVPPAWQPLMASGHTIKRMPLHSCLDLIAEVIHLKIEENKKRGEIHSEE